MPNKSLIYLFISSSSTKQPRLLSSTTSLSRPTDKDPVDGVSPTSARLGRNAALLPWAPYHLCVFVFIYVLAWLLKLWWFFHKIYNIEQWNESCAIDIVFFNDKHCCGKVILARYIRLLQHGGSWWSLKNFRIVPCINIAAMFFKALTRWD